MKIIFLILILVTILTGCTDETIIVKEVEIQKSWQPVAQFENLTKIKTNSYSTDNFLFVYGPRYFSSINKQNQISHAFTRLNYPSFYKLPIFNYYFIEADREWIRFVLTEEPVYDAGATSINLKDLEPTFTSIQFGAFYQNEAISINNAGQCLVPINSDNQNNELFLFLFTAEYDNNPRVKITDTVKISIITSSNNQFVYCTKAIDDYFILSIDNSTYKIYPDGSYKKILDTSIFNVFKQNDRLFAVKQFEQIFISDNQGETWESYQGYPDYLVLANYFILGDSIIAARNSDLFTIKITDNKYIIRPLLNDGLETNEITSISKFNDSIYVSTYSGVYFKGLSKFYKYKSEE